MKLQDMKIYIKNYLNIFILAAILLFLLVINNLYTNYKKNEVKAFEKIKRNIYLNKTIHSFLDNLSPRYQKFTYKVKFGDSFEKILTNIDLSQKETKLILKEISKKKEIVNLVENQVLNFKIDNKNSKKLVEINFQFSKKKNFLFSRIENENLFKIKEIETNLKKKINYAEARIKNSLYASAIKEGIPANVIVEFARIYGFEIDFQRDIWKNDIFQIIYENFVNEKNETIQTGNIIFANLVLQGREYPLYIFNSDGKFDHYDNRGQSIKKTLMKTPINGARLSSSFGKRKHPILGFTKMHTGTDFAAPTGTPIMASGSGKVIKSSWCGGGGNCVKIKHNSVYTTVYAHLSKFGRGIKKGARVKQGQIIGYVGSTGMSTGPHLHYEVIVNGKKVNSQTLKLPSGKTLNGDERKKFEVEKIKINVLRSDLIASGI